MDLLPALISDLGLILITAAISVVVFKILKQPLVLGYIIAGYLAGPYFKYMPSVQEVGNIEVWAEIGVIFLLFSLGLEFSFKKLMQVGGGAAVTGIFQVLFMLLAGYITGWMMGWKALDSLFLGAMLSMSSTTIIIKSLEELNLKGMKFVSLVFGSLIIEDIVAILLMVLLTTIAVSQHFSGIELLFSFVKLAFFLIIWFIAGIFIIPSVLRKVRRHLNEEMLMIVSLGLCLLMVLIGVKAGFSSALGAFVMGSIIAGTIFSEKIVELVAPVKNLFGAVFFVSVGMMINPHALVEYFIPVVLITIVAIFGKTLSTTIGAILSGQPLNQSVQTGMSHAPIGEFSFIIATLGMSLGVIGDYLYPIIVAVSTITIFLTPYLIKGTDKTIFLLEKYLPKRLKDGIDQYSANMSEAKSKTAWNIFFRKNTAHVVLMTVVIIAINLISFSFIELVDEVFTYGKWMLSIVTLLVLLPFLWSLGFNRLNPALLKELQKDKRLKGQVLIIFFFRISLTLFFLGFYLSTFFSFVTSVITFLLVVVFSFLFPRKIQRWYRKLESRFLENYNIREITEANELKNYLAPWDGHMTKITIPPESSLSGLSLAELELRERFGINIAIVKRGELSIYIPHRTEVIFPNDILYIIGSDEQIIAFNHFIENTLITPITIEDHDFVLKHIELTTNKFCCQTIKESKIRELTGGLVVGIDRDGEHFLNPKSDFFIEQGDIIWIVGERERMKILGEIGNKM